MPLPLRIPAFERPFCLDDWARAQLLVSQEHGSGRYLNHRACRMVQTDGAVLCWNDLSRYREVVRHRKLVRHTELIPHSDSVLYSDSVRHTKLVHYAELIRRIELVRHTKLIRREAVAWTSRTRIKHCRLSYTRFRPHFHGTS